MGMGVIDRKMRAGRWELRERWDGAYGPDEANEADRQGRRLVDGSTWRTLVFGGVFGADHTLDMLFSWYGTFAIGHAEDAPYPFMWKYSAWFNRRRKRIPMPRAARARVEGSGMIVKPLPSSLPRPVMPG